MVRKLNDFSENRLKGKKKSKESKPASESYVVSAIKLLWLRQRERDRRSFVWKGKISPSSLIKGFRTCPKQMIIDAQKQSNANIDGIERMEIGKIYHLIMQRDAQDCDDLLWSKPNIPESLEEFRTKFEKHWPEVPVMDLEARISGRADLVINIQRKPVVVDLKIPQEKDLDKWHEIRDTLPEDSHIAQVCFYIHVMNKYKYYDIPIEMGGIVYYNPYIPEAKGIPEKEYYFNYSDFKEDTEDLINHVTQHCIAFSNNVDLPCAYSKCETHNA